MYNFRTAGYLTFAEISKRGDQCLTVSPGAQHLGAMLKSRSVLASRATYRGHQCDASSSTGQRATDADISIDHGKYYVYTDSNQSLEFIVITAIGVQGTQMQLPHLRFSGRLDSTCRNVQLHRLAHGTPHHEFHCLRKQAACESFKRLHDTVPHSILRFFSRLLFLPEAYFC